MPRYRQQVKDSANPPNESAWSDWVEKTTLLNPPEDAEITFANVTEMGMDVTVATPPKPSGAGSTGAYFYLITGEGQGSGATDRVYADDYTAEYTNLIPNTQYGWKVKYRNRDGVETAYNPTEQKRYTLASTPPAPTVSNPTPTTLDVTINENGNPDHTLFAIYNVTGGYYINASGGSNGGTAVWRTKSDWGTVTVVNLTPETTYEFECKAKNGDEIETPFGASGYGTTTATPDTTPPDWSNLSNVAQETTLASPPVIDSLSLTSGVVGTQVTISGSNFGDEQGDSTVTFNGVDAGVADNWIDTEIKVKVPVGATTGPVVVTVSGQASNNDKIFTVIQPPVIGSINPTSGPIGTQVTIQGSNFGLNEGDEKITVEEILYGDVSGDGSVSAYDASLILQYVVGSINLSQKQREAADVSDNGTISALDAALILQYTVGLIEKFPADSAPVAPDLNPPDEIQTLTKAIEQFETISLTKEQKQVLEQLKNLVFSQLIPKHTALLQNYPNPFNPETWIPFELATDASVTLSIYNTKGQLIRIIALGQKVAGMYLSKDKAAYWDGRDNFGGKVSSGVYFYTLQAGEFVATRKLVVVK